MFKYSVAFRGYWKYSTVDPLWYLISLNSTRLKSQSTRYSAFLWLNKHTVSPIKSRNAKSEIKYELKWDWKSFLIEDTYLIALESVRSCNALKKMQFIWCVLFDVNLAQRSESFNLHSTHAYKRGIGSTLSFAASKFVAVHSTINIHSLSIHEFCP